MEQNREFRKISQYTFCVGGGDGRKVLFQLEIRMGYLINNASITIKSPKENKSRLASHKLQNDINCLKNKVSNGNQNRTQGTYSVEIRTSFLT